MAAITVTAAESVATFNGVLIRVKVLTGIAASPIGATAIQLGSAAHQQVITTTQTGSQVYGALLAVSGTAFTANAQSTLFDNNVDVPNGLVAGSCRSASPTGTPGAETIGASAPVANGGCALLEILPAGTITEDASGPAGVYNGSGTSAVTALFTPPAGSLLVAMVAADASAATVVTVTDSSSLTWTQRVVAQSAGNSYTGVWTAAVPAAPVTLRQQQQSGRSMLRKRLWYADV